MSLRGILLIGLARKVVTGKSDNAKAEPTVEIS